MLSHAIFLTDSILPSRREFLLKYHVPVGPRQGRYLTQEKRFSGTYDILLQDQGYFKIPYEKNEVHLTLERAGFYVSQRSSALV